MIVAYNSWRSGYHIDLFFNREYMCIVFIQSKKHIFYIYCELYNLRICTELSHQLINHKLYVETDFLLFNDNAARVSEIFI